MWRFYPLLFRVSKQHVNTSKYSITLCQHSHAMQLCPFDATKIRLLNCVPEPLTQLLNTNVWFHDNNNNNADIRKWNEIKAWRGGLRCNITSCIIATIKPFKVLWYSLLTKLVVAPFVLAYHIVVYVIPWALITI